MRVPVLALTGISKRFGSVQALSDVDLTVGAGEVVALVGDNGAGKSTLAKVIAGVEPAESGAICWLGHYVSIGRPHDAAALGIATVYQDLSLCDNLDVVANLFLGNEKVRVGLLDDIAMECEAREQLTSLSVPLPSLRVPVSALSGGQRHHLDHGGGTVNVLPVKREPPLDAPPALAPPAAGRPARARRQRGVTARLRAGELEALPVLISLMATWVIFQTLDHNHRFLTAGNLSNMVVQVAAVGMMAVGITLVLLLGETDLSIGSVSGLAAAVLAILVVRHDVPEVLAIGLVVLLGLVVGTVQGGGLTQCSVVAPSPPTGPAERRCRADGRGAELLAWRAGRPGYGDRLRGGL